MERTYVMLKPEALKRGIAGKVISRIEEKGFKITHMKTIYLLEETLKEHYAHIADKPFFPAIFESMTEGPVIGMVVESEDVVQGMMNMCGPTKWLDAPVGTIRGDFANNTQKNIIHRSDSVESAEIEIKRFFPELF